MKSCQILFICSGNTCRSPLAAALLAGMLTAPEKERTHIVSAGTGAISGAPASDGALRAAEEAGFSLAAHRSRRLSRDLVVESDLILAMEASHRAAAIALDPSAAERTHLLLGFAAGLPAGEGDGVRDPMGGTDRDYRRAVAEIRAAIVAAHPRIAACGEDVP